MNSGILLLTKPPGISSARALGPLKRIFAGRKIGHTGTLDPFASGLLVVMVGRATRMAPWFTSLDKQYAALVRFGMESDTLDPEGTIIAEAPVPETARVIEVLPRFTGSIQQVPPAFSAVHIDGRRAYDLARQGLHVEIPARAVTIFSLTMTPTTSSAHPERYRMEVHCGSGTYIRSLARDIAREAGSVASLETLERTSVGPFLLRNATDLDTVRSSSTPDDFLVPLNEAVRRLPDIGTISLPPDLEKPVRVGTPLSTGSMEPVRALLAASEVTTVLLTDEGGREVSLCQFSAADGQWRYRVVFAA